MKILLIGSTQYRDKFLQHKRKLLKAGHQVRTPKFDDFKGTELEMCCMNRKLVEWCDELHIIWDGRSLGTIFDIGMAYALRKPWRLVYLEKKSFVNLIKQHEEQTTHRSKIPWER